MDDQKVDEIASDIFNFFMNHKIIIKFYNLVISWILSSPKLNNHKKADFVAESKDQ